MFYVPYVFIALAGCASLLVFITSGLFWPLGARLVWFKQKTRAAMLRIRGVFAHATNDPHQGSLQTAWLEIGP